MVFLLLLLSGWCVLIGVAGAAFDFYASILLHIVVCTDRQSIFYAFPSLCTLLRQRQLFNNFCFMPEHIKNALRCYRSIRFLSFPSVFWFLSSSAFQLLFSIQPIVSTNDIFISVLQDIKNSQLHYDMLQFSYIYFNNFYCSFRYVYYFLFFTIVYY